MEPPIERSIVQVGVDLWIIGSRTICERNPLVLPEQPLAYWRSDSGDDFYLRDQPAADLVLTEERRENDSARGRVHFAGTAAAVWAFGGVHVKVKAWAKGVPLENDIIGLVRSNTRVPTPQVVFSWVDLAWNRSFTILESVKGQTLSQRWPSLSEKQRTSTAKSVAAHCQELATLTSSRLETCDGKGVMEPYLTASAPRSEPSWKPRLLGPFGMEQLRAYLSHSPCVDRLEQDFLFYHADLGPGNIMVDESGAVVAIIDWESAAYYPRFWLGTKPLVSAGFNLAGQDKSSWALEFAQALASCGFEEDQGLYADWRRALEK